MDILEQLKDKIEEIVKKITTDKTLAAKFKADPITTVEGLLGMDILRLALERAYAAGCRQFISGMARGADLYFAEAVLALREKYPDALLECARPCESQSNRWPREEKLRYEGILERCNYETMVQHTYDRGCMMRRNIYMVDHSARIIALYDGVPKGGTAQTLAYAKRKGLEIDIIPLE